MSLLTYGLLEQTTTQRKCQPGGQKVRRESDITETRHGKNTDVNENKEAIAWTELPLECIRHVENSIKHTNL